jgi:hypothetical protein
MRTPVGVAQQGAEGKGVAEVLPSARVTDVGQQLMARGYQVGETSVCDWISASCR